MSNFTQSNVATPQSSCSSESGTQTQVGSLGPQNYTIAGVKVEFPAKAYPSQLAMMSKVIQSLNKRQNCLLESPTGSGKSLALLCAALAWQRQEAARVEEYNGNIADRQHAAMLEQVQKEMMMEAERKNVGGGTNQLLDTNTLKSCEGTETGLWKEPEKMEIPSHESSLLTSDDESMEAPGIVDLVTDDEDDDDFQPMKKVSLRSPPAIGKENLPTPARPVRSEGRSTKEEEKETVEEEYVPTPSEHKLTVPKIFFGTRTHKQISQITRELRKTHYKTSRSVVLASREHTCIHPVVQKSANKNEACKELLDDQIHGGCVFQNSAKKFGNFYTLSDYVEPGYDLEDFVKAGRNARACPYFAARHLMLQADIIFCPYNYLIDPFIRKSMSIELDNQIVIFDEAHNMEDAAREASSFVVSQDELQMAMQDFEKIGSTNGCFQPYAHQQLAKLMSMMSGWMDSKESDLKALSFENSGKYWTGAELLAELEISGINAELVKMNLEYLQVILRHRDEEFEKQKERGTMRLPDGEKTPELQAMTVKTAENVFLIFESLNARGGVQMGDFRIALLKNSVRRRRERHIPGFVSKEVLSLNIWCLNPAVAFHYLKDAVHSIVLTSGTLSPMQSFESELGVSFPIKLEASHVIDRSQVFASMLGIGPSNQKLNGSYRSVDTFQYQDELGELVLRICQEMPRGVLVFFPSYRLLEKVQERWEITGCWKKINYCKRVLVEPRSGASDFEHAIECFYEANASPIPPQTGGMFLAVCRGKVSEGIDFADHNARAVICVGIPFPNFKDLQVELKRNYNSDNRSRGLLSGGEWYEIQAFRALNQALGRCIRHRMDWGAIILVDERFILNSRYTQSLSKWVRNSVEGYKSWEPFMRKLVEFRENMSCRPVPEPSIETITIHDSSNESSFRSERDIADSSSSFSSHGSANSTPGTKEPNLFAYTAFNNGGGRNNGNGRNVGNPRNRPGGSGGQQRMQNAQSPSPDNIKGTIPAMFLVQQRAAKRQRDQSNW